MNWSELLRIELRARADAWAERYPRETYLSKGANPTRLFVVAKDRSRHLNFLDEAWTAIEAFDAWSKRLGKPHSRRSALPEPHNKAALELDSSNSSDALLMNCFCPKGAAMRISKALGLSPTDAVPEFGLKPGLALKDGTADSTEVDMRLADTLFEAKLTEGDFTSRPRIHLLRYRDLEQHFDLDALPASDDTMHGYQLVRNVLAAAQNNMRLRVVIDCRRPDLLQEWWAVHAAIRDVSLRRRCGILTWQEVAAVCAEPQRDALRTKYGI